MKSSKLEQKALENILNNPKENGSRRRLRNNKILRRSRGKQTENETESRKDFTEPKTQKDSKSTRETDTCENKNESMFKTSFGGTSLWGLRKS
jgi:hypothetical protein